MLIAACIATALAALLHVYIFVMESITWTSARTRATFSLTEAEAVATREMAFNQGFYNLFLAIIGGIGVVTTLSGLTSVGVALMLAATGSMLAAAVVLVASSRDRVAAALKQGVLPVIAVVLTVAALAL